MSLLSKKSAHDTVRFTLPFSLALVFSGASEVSAQSKEETFHVNKTFDMEVQLTPFTNPGNPASRTVTVDCGTLDVGPGGQLYVTGEFVKPFDLEPFRAINPGAHPATEGTAMINHIGSMTATGHEICVAQSQVYGGNQRDLPRPHEIRSGTTTYKTSVPFTDDRYCPVFAALKACTVKTEDDALMSPVYNVDPATGDITLNLDQL